MQEFDRHVPQAADILHDGLFVGIVADQGGESPAQPLLL